MGALLFFNGKKAARKNSRDVPFFCFCNGQGITEYAILIAIVSAVIVGMQYYMRTSIQGVIKAAADQVGSQEDSWEDVDVENAVKTDTKVIDTSSSTTGAKTMLGGSYKTDINETSNLDLWYGHSESEQEKY